MELKLEKGINDPGKKGFPTHKFAAALSEELAPFLIAAYGKSKKK